MEGPYAVVEQGHVCCPHCAESYEVPQEFYGALAECPDCGMEFTIMPPGTPPPAAFQSAPAPAPVMAEPPAENAPKPAHVPDVGATPEAPAPGFTPKAAGNNTAFWIAIGVLGLLVIALVIKVMFFS